MSNLNSEVTIPKQLQNPEFRFVLLGTWNKWRNVETNEIKIFEPNEYQEIDKKSWKPFGKTPFEKTWQDKGYKFNDKKLISHINRGKNFGVIGKYGNLRILDVDDIDLSAFFLEKLNTFTIKTGSGGTHFYFISDYKKNHVLAREKGELRSYNYQVVCPPCRHPSGKRYKVIKDLPIQEISSEHLFALIKPYLREKQSIPANLIETTEKLIRGEKTGDEYDTSRSGKEYRVILNLLRKGKIRSEIYEEMKLYSKWSSSKEQYRSLTYEKAEEFYLNELERKQQEKKEPIPNKPTKEVLELLKNPNFLEIINKEFDKKIIREYKTRKTIFMIAMMSNVENLGKATDNCMINSASGSGKDHITEAIWEIFPDEEKLELIRITPKVLAYTRNKNIDPKATWVKMKVRFEDVSNNVLNDDAFKVMSSANPNKINLAQSVQKGKIIDIAIHGKPSMVITTAEANPKNEQLRRYPICGLNEGIDQTKEILKRQGEFAKVGKTLEYNPLITDALRHLKRIKVKIPYAEDLVKIFCPENLIVRTHFPRFLDYIKSGCSLHQYQREQDSEGFFIAEKQDYDIARMMLQKTTSNILMIPLTQLQKKIMDFFEEMNLQKKSIDDLEEYKEIQKLGIDTEWLRRQVKWLASKGFLLRDSEKRLDASGRIISKPVHVFSYNKMQTLEIPEWNNISSFTPNKQNNPNCSLTSNSGGVNEQNEVNSRSMNIINTTNNSKITNSWDMNWEDRQKMEGRVIIED